MIVKSDLNYRGVPELNALTLPGRALRRIRWMLTGTQMRTIETKADYRILPSLGEAPPEYFTPESVVQKLVLEKDGEKNLLREYMFLGNLHDENIERTSAEIFTEDKHISCEPFVPHPRLLQLPRQLNLSYGKIDYVIADGEPFIFDANKTIGMGPTGATEGFGEGMRVMLKAFAEEPPIIWRVSSKSARGSSRTGTGVPRTTRLRWVIRRNLMGRPPVAAAPWEPAAPMRGELPCGPAIWRRSAKRELMPAEDLEGGIRPGNRLAIGVHKATRKAERSAGLHEMRIGSEPLTETGAAEVICGQSDGNKAASRPAAFGGERCAAGEAHGIVGQRRNQAAVYEAARVAVRLRQPESDGYLARRAARIERLPGISEPRFAEMRRVAFGGGELRHATYFPSGGAVRPAFPSRQSLAAPAPSRGQYLVAIAGQAVRPWSKASSPAYALQ